MNGLGDLNLLRFLDFYFTLMFFIGLYRRVGQYRDMGRLALSGPARWPRLLDLVKHHHTIFLTWATFLPALLTLMLAILQIAASRKFWPDAELTIGQLAEHWLALIVVVPLGMAMLGIDLYCAFRVGRVDRTEMEKYFDQAEYWLRSGTAHAVRIFTFGYVNPRQMVHVEVRKALVQVSQLLQVNLWWLTAQTGFRSAFALACWGTWVAIG
jgi:hypothetical protein